MDYSELNKIKINNESEISRLLNSPYLLEQIFEYSEIYLNEDYIYGKILKAKDYADRFIVDIIQNKSLD